jgi:non-specific serine/threonine protein kinase
MTLEVAAEYALDKVEHTTLSSCAPGASSSDQWPASLTPRQEEVAVLIARGFTNRRIASELSISEHTAATHVRKILKKLGLRSRSEIAAWVTERRQSPLDVD